MVLTMSHTGVKFIIDKISASLEQEFKVKEIRDKIIDRTVTEKSIPIDPGLIEEARRMGREGLLTNMVLFDMNREEAKQMAQRNLLEYRTDGKPGQKRPAQTSSALLEQSTFDDSLSGAVSGDETTVRKIKHGSVTMTETIKPVGLDKIKEIIKGREITDRDTF